MVTMERLVQLARKVSQELMGQMVLTELRVHKVRLGLKVQQGRRARQVLKEQQDRQEPQA